MRLGTGLLAVRAGEGRLVGLLAALFATVEAGRGLGDVAVTTLFLNRVGAASLPWLFIALGLVSLVVSLAYGAAIGRLPRRTLFVGLLVAFAVALGLLRVASEADSIPVYGLLWVVVNVVNAILLTVVWTIAGTTLDARQAKRLFPLCMSAAIAGSFAGTLAAGPLAGLLGTANLVVLESGLLLAAGALAAAVVGRSVRATATTERPGLRAQLRRGFDDVRASPLLRLIAVGYVLFAVLLFSVSFPYQGVLQRTFAGDEAGLATTVGLIQAGVTAISFLVSLAVANRVYARFGVAAAALALPLVYAAGFGLWLVQFGLASAIAVVVAQQVVQRSLSNAAWSAMYNVVPTERRPQVLAFVDGVPGQLGTSLSGVLLLLAGALFATNQAPIFAMGLVTALASTWVVVLIRRRYGQALVRTLRAGLAEQVLEGGPGLAAMCRAPGVLDELCDALADPNPGSRRLATELLGALGSGAAVGPLTARLDDEAAEVRAAALRALTAHDPARAAEAGARLADDPSAPVRAELVVTLAAAGRAGEARALVDGLLGASEPGVRTAGLRAAGRIGDASLVPRIEVELGSADRGVRAAAAEALGRIGRGVPGFAPGALVAALDDDAAVVRRAAATALAGTDGATEAILGVLATGSDRAQETAVVALSGGPDTAREPLRAWALERVERAIRLRQAGGALGPAASAVDEAAGPPEPALDYLRTVLDRRGRRFEEQLLAAVGALGAPEAPGLLRRSLRSPDPDTRAQAVEAIDATGDRRLGRAVVRLLDSETGGGSADADGTLRTLVDDVDPWIRSLAIRATADRLAQRYAEVVERAATDPHPTVRTQLASMRTHGGPTMADTASTLGELDRMLFLRRVPLFSQFEPEDLQRVAAAATERLYPAGEALVREGEQGDTLIVIVEGRVRVTRADGETDRLLRIYEAGDHIGELAVLRDRPRAATVTAETAVRGLVIGGEALRAILTERPEAAMAMLGTLAERISAQ